MSAFWNKAHIAAACCLPNRYICPPTATAGAGAPYAGGSSLTIKVARTSQSEQQCVENTLAAIEAALDKVPRKWDGVKVGMHGRTSIVPHSLL